MRAVIAEMPARWLEERRNSDASQWDEMWDGVLHMAPMPSWDHQDLVGSLNSALRMHWAKPSGGKACHDVNVVKPEKESDWTADYRVPDLVLVSSDRLSIIQGKYLAGPPLVCVEIHSPGDESYAKLDFYADLGVPEVWIVDRDSKRPEIYVLAASEYKLQPVDADGWLRSSAANVTMRAANGKLEIRFANGAAALLPD